MVTAFIKLALLFQYLRLFELWPKMKLFTTCIIVITALWGLAYSYIAWVPCIPVHAYWDISVADVTRYGFGSHDPGVFARTYESHVATNVVLDLVVFAIPLPLYFEAGLETKSRLGLVGLFLLGIV
jgi:hypothetical protein